MKFLFFIIIPIENTISFGTFVPSEGLYLLFHLPTFVKQIRLELGYWLFSIAALRRVWLPSVHLLRQPGRA